MREENQADIEFSKSDDISILNLDVGQFYKDIEVQDKVLAELEKRGLVNDEKKIEIIKSLQHTKK